MRKWLESNISIRSIFALICVFLSITGMERVYATNTGFLNPNTCSSVDSGGPGWSNTNNASTSDNSYATASVNDGQTSDYLKCVGYSFNIPAGATINGITVNIERKSSNTGGSSRDAAVQLVKANVITATNRATTTIYTTSDAVEAHGGTSDLWNDSWSSADINNANFGVALEVIKPGTSGGARTISVDVIRIAVDYTDTTAPTVASINRANMNPTSAPSVNWIVTFSEDVTGVTAANFNLLPTGLSGTPSITSVSGSGSVWTVTATTGSGSGTLGLNMSSATGVTDLVGNQLTGLPVVGQLYSIDPTAASQCYNDDFNRVDGNPGSDWIVGREGASSFTPGIVNQSLRLTNNSQSASTYATLQRIFPGAGNKIIVEFTQYSYGGSGADGMGIVLSDASKPLAAGAFGGSLGYAPKQQGAPFNGDTTHEGFAGGWLGVGLDELGNYSNPTEGRTGGPGPIADSVAVRGSGSGYTGYGYLRGTGTLSPGIDNAGSSAQAPGYRYRIVVDHSDSVHAWTSVERDTTGTGNNYSFVVPVFDAKSDAGQAAVPTNWLLSYTGATGSLANIHEIDSLRVCSVTQVVPTLHHIELDHPSTGCNPVPVLVKACADVACSTLYTGPVTVNLNAFVIAGGGSAIFSPDPVSFSGGQTTVTLAPNNNNNGRTIQIGGTATSPSATSAAVCLSDAGVSNCMINTVLACFDAVELNQAPATPIYTKLAGVPFSLRILAVKNGGTAIDTSYGSSSAGVGVSLVDPTASSGNCGDTAAGLTSINYSQGPFSNGQLNNGSLNASFTYPNAAKNVKVRITANGVSTCSRDNFAIRPKSFNLTTSATAQPTAPIPTDSHAAGQNFTLTATAMGAANPTTNPDVAVTAGYGGTPTLDLSQVSTNPLTTPIPLSGNFAAGTGISSAGTNFQYHEVGAVAVSTNTVTDKTFTAVDQVTGTVNSVDHGPNPDCLVASTANTSGSDPKRHGCTIGSNAITLGRFRPDHFALSDAKLTNRSDLSCSPVSSFTYIGEPMAAKFTLTAQNAGNQTTKNYVGAWAKLVPSVPVTPGLNPLGLGAVDIALPRTPFAACTATPTHPCVMPATATGDFVAGEAKISLPFSVYRDVAATAGPYSLLDVGVAPMDSDGVQMATFDLDTVNVVAGTNNHVKVEQTDVRYGRLKLANANGSELMNMSVQAVAEYWKNGVGFVTNAADNCTVIAASAIKLQNPVGGLNATNMPSNNFIASPLTFAAGKAVIIVNKPLPVPASKGSADLCIDLASDNTPGTVCTATSANMPWLQGKWNGAAYDDDPGSRATFGVFRSGPVLYLREMY